MKGKCEFIFGRVADATFNLLALVAAAKRRAEQSTNASLRTASSRHRAMDTNHESAEHVIMQVKMQRTPAENAEATARNASELVLRKSMIQADLQDRKHRDWCIISATGITDSWGFVALETGHGDIPELIHKRELHSRIGDKAETWWSKRLRLRRHRQ